MNNLMNRLFTKLANFAQTPSVITNATDKLLNYLLPKDEVVAQVTSCVIGLCTRCRNRLQKCNKCCLVNGKLACWHTYRFC